MMHETPMNKVMVKKLNILGLRGFGVLQSIEFAMPNGKEGSGITFIVGSNNSGKTTVLEALAAFNTYKGTSPSFSEKKRNSKVDNPQIQLSIVSDRDEEYIIQSDENGGSTTIFEKKSDDKEEMWYVPNAFVLQSRRFLEYEFHKSEMGRLDYIMNSHANNNRKANVNEFNNRLFKMHRNKKEFDKILKQLLGYELEWTLEQNDNGSYYIKIFTNGNTHSSEGIGDGIWSIFTICDALYDSEDGGIIAIDEPELSLHPAYQKRVMEMLKYYAKDRQVIINTHSPYFIDINSIINGAELYRCIKNMDDDINLFNLSEDSRKELKGFLKDINQPHTLGIEAKEVFFLLDNIILVEGQEDVVMYNRAMSELGISLDGEFFGWGAGGAPKMPKILKILRDLGYKCVAAIYDGDKLDDMEKEKENYPEYKFFCISAGDIRDKEESGAKKAKDGLMTKGGKIKWKHKEELEQLFCNINDYLSKPNLRTASSEER